MSFNAKMILFLIGIMILGTIGGTIFPLFSLIRDLAFIVLIFFLGYLLYKKLFKK